MSVASRKMKRIHMQALARLKHGAIVLRSQALSDMHAVVWIDANQVGVECSIWLFASGTPWGTVTPRAVCRLTGMMALAAGCRTSCIQQNRSSDDSHSSSRRAKGREFIHSRISTFGDDDVDQMSCRMRHAAGPARGAEADLSCRAHFGGLRSYPTDRSGARDSGPRMSVQGRYG